jgi:ferredoxin-NADP reductase
VWWLHTSRTADQHPMAAEAQTLLAALPHSHTHVFYSSDHGLAPDIVHGRLTARSIAELGVPADATAYVCGPSGFMDDMQTALTEAGVAADRIHTELFGALAAINPGVTDVSRVHPHQPPGEPGDGPLITFARSGLACRWSNAYSSVLELAEACDIPTRWACRTGVCHTCVTKLLSGTVRYNPTPLDSPGAGAVLVCCSRPADDLVLDL